MEGFKDECLARCVLEIYAWLKRLKDERTILADTIEFARMELINSGILREGASAAPCRIRLPLSTKSYEAKTFESGGWANLYGANPLSESTETEFLSCLHGELNLKFAMNLEESPVVDLQAGSPDSPKRYIVVGSSHAGRLCSELSQIGHTVIDVIRPGWRVMPSTVLSMKELLEKRIKAVGGCKHIDICVPVVGQHAPCCLGRRTGYYTTYQRRSGQVPCAGGRDYCTSIHPDRDFQDGLAYFEGGKKL
jgi:hypothetical protein